MEVESTYSFVSCSNNEINNFNHLEIIADLSNNCASTINENLTNDLYFQTIKTLETNLVKNKSITERIKIIASFIEKIEESKNKYSEFQLKLLEDNLFEYLHYETDGICFNLIFQLIIKVLDSYHANEAVKKVLGLIKTGNNELICEIYKFLVQICKCKNVEISLISESIQMVLNLLQKTNSSTLVQSLLEYMCKIYHSEKYKLIININTLLQFLSIYLRDKDYRIRAFSLKCLIDIYKLDLKHCDSSLYNQVIELLDDDHEHVRSCSITFITVFSRNILRKDPEDGNNIQINEQSFLSLCSIVICDPSYKIRCIALEHIGKFSNLSSQVLINSVNRQLFSSSNTRKSYHQRQREIYGGRDEGIEIESTNEPDVMRIQRRCPDGAFIDSLEEEHWEVRIAAVKALYKICKRHISKDEFRESAIDLIIDSFADTSHAVQILAIKSLTKLLEKIKIYTDSKTKSLLSSSYHTESDSFENRNEIDCHFVISDNQLDAIISTLSDVNSKIRNGLYSLVSYTTYVSPISLHAVILCLLENLQKYPKDTNAIFKCLENISLINAHYVASIVHNLFDWHPFIDLPEPSLTDKSHVALLIVIYNVSCRYSPILSLLPSYFHHHFKYLKTSFPHYLHDESSTNTLLLTSSECTDSNFMSIVSQIIDHKISTSVNVDNLFDIDQLLLYLSDISKSPNENIAANMNPLKSLIQNFKDLYIIRQTFSILDDNMMTFSNSSDNINVSSTCLSIINNCNKYLLFLQSLSENHSISISIHFIQLFCFGIYLLLTHKGEIINFISELSIIFDFLNKNKIFVNSGSNIIIPELLSTPLNITNNAALYQLFHILTQVSVKIDLKELLKYFKFINADLKVSIPDFDKSIKFHYSRQLKIQIDAKIINIQSTKDLFLKIQIPPDNIIYFDLSSITVVNNDDSSINLSNFIYLSFLPWTDYATITFTIVIKAFTFHQNYLIYDNLVKLDQSNSSKLDKYIDLSKPVSIRCHPHS